MALKGIYSTNALYLKTFDSFGNEMQNKIWGTLNARNITYEQVDEAIRALNGLSKNTYNDSIIDAPVNLGVILLNDEYKNKPIGDVQSITLTYLSKNINNFKIFGSLNPSVTYQTVNDALKKDDTPTTSGVNPTSLYYLMPAFSGNNDTNLNSKISVNEQINA